MKKNSKGWKVSSHQFDYLLKWMMGTVVYPLPQPRSQVLCLLDKRVEEGPGNEIAYCHRSNCLRKINVRVRRTNNTRSSPKEGIWITTLLEFLMRGQLSLNSYEWKKKIYYFFFQQSITLQNSKTTKTREKDVPLLLF